MDYKIKGETLSGIAEAIRSKTGDSELFTASEFAGKIGEISGGKEEEKANVFLDFAGGDMTVLPEDGKVFGEVSIPKPETLLPENIREGKAIAGIEGTLTAYELENKTVALDFSGGDMAFIPESGKAFGEFDIPKPETLLPENIAEGIDIAGIIGTLAGGGGGNIKTAWGTFSGQNGTAKVVTHGLGVVPDFVIVCPINYAAESNGEYCMLIGYSAAFKAKIGSNYPGFGVSKTSSAYSFGQLQKSIDVATGNYFIANATTETVAIDQRLTTGRNYVWIAVGGMT